MSAIHKILSSEQRAYTGFTDLYVVKAATHLTESTDNTDQIITLDSLSFGDLVKNDICCEIKTAFANASANMTLAISVGVTSSAAELLAATTLTSSGTVQTEGTAKHVIVPVHTILNYATPSGGKDLILTFDITDADGDLASIETGELWIWANILRQDQRAQIQV